MLYLLHLGDLLSLALELLKNLILYATAANHMYSDNQLYWDACLQCILLLKCAKSNFIHFFQRLFVFNLQLFTAIHAIHCILFTSELETKVCEICSLSFLKVLTSLALIKYNSIFL